MNIHTVSAQLLQDTISSNKAINFGIGGSSGVALQYWFNNNHAVIGGFGLSFGTQNVTPNAPIDPFEAVGLSLFAQYRYYLIGRQQFAPFIGFGGGVSWQQDRYTNAAQYLTRFNSGIALGMEYFILPWLSVCGQIGLGASYTLYSVERPPLTNPLPSFYQKNFRIDLGTNSVLVSLYF